MVEKKILITGASGQIGSILSRVLSERYGPSYIVTSDIRNSGSNHLTFESLDIRDAARLKELIGDHNIGTIYHMAAILSANGEKDPRLTWEVNLDAWFRLLEIAIELNIEKIFFPSTIAVFGPYTPRDQTPQFCNLTPTTVYGMSKAAGENLANYFFHRYGLDVRSIRYPGIISWDSEPGGGTTDYAVEIFHEAIKHRRYTSYIDAHTRLPMMYMPDAIEATIQLMKADSNRIRIRTSYNLAAFSFTPAELAALIKNKIPDFVITYAPDFRQQIASSWPQSIDDSSSRQDWLWKPSYTLEAMVDDILDNLTKL